MSVPLTGYESPITHYDEVTGVTLTIVDRDNYDVRKKRQPKRKRRVDYSRTHGNSRYVRCNHAPVRDISGKLKIHELGALIKLLPYMSRKHGGGLFDNGKLMGVTEISAAIRKNRRTTDTLISALVTSGVMTTDKEGKRNVYGINPLYHAFGDEGGLEHYTKLYQSRTKLRIDDISLQAAGLLYKTLPYFHYARYYLCANPNERDGGRIRHLTQAALAELIGEDAMVVSRHLRELSKAGFIMRMDAYGNSVLRVNPEILYRRRTLDDVALRLIDDFNEVKNAADWRNGERIDGEELPY